MLPKFQISALSYTPQNSCKSLSLGYMKVLQQHKYHNLYIMVLLKRMTLSSHILASYQTCITCGNSNKMQMLTS